MNNRELSPPPKPFFAPYVPPPRVEPNTTYPVSLMLIMALWTFMAPESLVRSCMLWYPLKIVANKTRDPFTIYMTVLVVTGLYNLSLAVGTSILLLLIEIY